MVLPYALLNFIHPLMGLLICKYEPILQEVSVESLILRRLLRSVGLLLNLDEINSQLLIKEVYSQIHSLAIDFAFRS